MTPSLRAFVATTTIVCASTLAHGQVRDNVTPPTGAGAIAGVIVSDDAKAGPVRRVMVTLSSGDLRTPRMTVSDDEGRFAFANLPAGNFTLSARRTAYVPAFYGATTQGRGPGVPIALLSDQKITDIRLKLLHGSVISGTVRQESGRPATGLRITVQPVRMVNGRRTGELTVQLLTATTTTDDRGEYRAFGLAPGDYVVRAMPSPVATLTRGEMRQLTPAELQWAERWRSATPPTGQLPAPPPAGQTVTYAPVYFPGTADLQSAGVVTVGPSDERAGVDFSTLLVPTARISGVLLDEDGQPRSGVPVSMRPTESASADFLNLDSLVMGNRSMTAPDGAFSISNVSPGTYSLTARAAPRPAAGAKPGPNNLIDAAGLLGIVSGTSPFWAMEELSVNGQDLSGVTLQLRPGMTLSGRIEFDSTSLNPPADLTTVKVSLAPPSTGTSPMDLVGALLGSPAAGTVAADGTVSIKGLTPDKYRVSVTMPGMMLLPNAPGSGWVLKAAMLNGRDVSDLPFEVRPNDKLPGLVVTMTDHPTEFSGAVTDGAGRATARYQIIILPTDRTFWAAGSRRIVQARPATDGRFRVVGLPAGEYFVTAVTEVQPGQLADPGFLELAASAAIKITLADGEKKTQELKLGGG